MIFFGIALRNPFSNSTIKNSKCFTKDLSKNKFLEIELISDTSVIFSFSINLTSRQSHSGFSLDIGLFSHTIYIHILDKRHWDYDNDQWENYDQDY